MEQIEAGYKREAQDGNRCTSAFVHKMVAHGVRSHTMLTLSTYNFDTYSTVSASKGTYIVEACAQFYIDMLLNDEDERKLFNY